MTNKLIWLMPVTALAISAVVVTSTMAAEIKHPERPLGTTATAQTTVTQAPVPYILKIQSGTIGVFRGDSETPYRQLDMPISLLSDYDRELLEQGISVQTEAEIKSLIEDLTS